MEDYNFDVPEGMDLMVHRHSRDPVSSDVQQDCQTDVAPVCQTVSYVTRDEMHPLHKESGLCGLSAQATQYSAESGVGRQYLQCI